MRPLPSRVLFAVLAAAALTLGLVTAQWVFFVVAAMALFLLGTSLATSRVSVTRALDQFRNEAVEIQLWGGPPPGEAGVTFVLASVNLISVGIHMYFDASKGRPSHLKVAQAKKAVLTPGRVVIETARYVQWNRTKLSPQGGVAAVSIALGQSRESGERGPTPG